MGGSRWKFWEKTLRRQAIWWRFFLPIISCILNAYSRFFRELNSCAYSIASKLSNDTKYGPIGIMSRKDSPISIFNRGQHSPILLLFIYTYQSLYQPLFVLVSLFANADLSNKIRVKETNTLVVFSKWALQHNNNHNHAKAIRFIYQKVKILSCNNN